MTGEHAGVWYIDLKNDAGCAGSGEPPVKADVVMTMDSADFTKMFAGIKTLNGSLDTILTYASLRSNHCGQTH